VVRLPVGKRFFFHSVQTESGPIHPLFSGYRRLFPGLSRPGNGTDHSPTSSAENKEVWSYTSLPSCLHRAVLNSAQANIHLFPSNFLPPSVILFSVAHQAKSGLGRNVFWLLDHLQVDHTQLDTHTHTHTQTQTHTQIDTHTHTQTHTHKHTHKDTHTHTNTPFLSCILANYITVAH
jgi:hypothetical protein